MIRVAARVAVGDTRPALVAAGLLPGEPAPPTEPWVLIQLSDVHPVECYRVNAGGLEVFAGHLHRAPLGYLGELAEAWSAR